MRALTTEHHNPLLMRSSVASYSPSYYGNPSVSFTPSNACHPLSSSNYCNPLKNMSLEAPPFGPSHQHPYGKPTELFPASPYQAMYVFDNPASHEINPPKHYPYPRLYSEGETTEDSAADSSSEEEPVESEEEPVESEEQSDGQDDESDYEEVLSIFWDWDYANLSTFRLPRRLPNKWKKRNVLGSVLKSEGMR
jgi:hypothetical protein